MSARRDVAENTTAVGGVFQQWNVIRLVELNFIVSYIRIRSTYNQNANLISFKEKIK